MNPRLWPSTLRINHAMGLFCCSSSPLVPHQSFFIYSLFNFHNCCCPHTRKEHSPLLSLLKFSILDIEYWFHILHCIDRIGFCKNKRMHPTDLRKIKCFSFKYALTNESVIPLYLLMHDESLGLLWDRCSLRSLCLIINFKKKKVLRRARNQQSAMYPVIMLFYRSVYFLCVLVIL